MFERELKVVRVVLGYVDGVPEDMGGESAISPCGTNGDSGVIHRHLKCFRILDVIGKSEDDGEDLLWQAMDWEFRVLGSSLNQA